MTQTTADRPWKPAVLNGFRNRCPNCGEGKILHSYLKVHDNCPSCQEEFHHHRADDGPAYITILVVGHVMGLCLTLMWETLRPSPLTMALTISAIAIVTSLLMLPRIKSMIVALQWSRRMNGFEKAAKAAS
ncbi:DUF983 domain-containing protein [Cognatishimia sp. WU-CL00825]|uniref:DUF983 domain-containing protein n=1 Tax=Cognatishimia sp. WU-CL00825 TaxID=3127658 RepID=UPI0031070B85